MRRTTATDPYIQSFETKWCVDEKTYYLQTSPEFPLKILLAEYNADLFEIARVFRNEEHGNIHLREFTLVEWYRRYQDYRFLMDETESLIKSVAKAVGRTHFSVNGRLIEVDQPFRRMTFAEAFERYVGFNPFGMSREELCRAARDVGTRAQPDWSWNDIANCLIVDKIDAHLGATQPTFLIDYPPSMASLARLRHQSGHDVAERFELYVGQVELCNGYSELIDAEELRRRFAEDNSERRRLGYPVLPEDEDLLEALTRMPKTTGNALGFDRLLMLLSGENDIQKVTINI